MTEMKAWVEESLDAEVLMKAINEFGDGAMRGR